MSFDAIAIEHMKWGMMEKYLDKSSGMFRASSLPTGEDVNILGCSYKAVDLTNGAQAWQLLGSCDWNGVDWSGEVDGCSIRSWFVLPVPLAMRLLTSCQAAVLGKIPKSFEVSSSPCRLQQAAQEGRAPRASGRCPTRWTSWIERRCSWWRLLCCVLQRMRWRGSVCLSSREVGE